MPAESTIADVPCLACGCLCDDITLTVRDNRIVLAEKACPKGASWFFEERDDQPRAILDDAVARAASILSSAKSPLILGLTQTSLETQRAAVALADRIGATIDPGISRESLARWKAIQRVGIVGATLGEVKARADVIVFWGVDPVVSHPRHMERYSAGATGRFVPDGRAGRIVVVVDESPTASSAVADRFVRIVRDEQGEVLATLRALVNGRDIPDADEPLKELAETMKSASYGAFFFGGTLGCSANVEEALKLVRDLNVATRFVALTMGSPGNAAGAEAVLSWQAGSPAAVDFSAGYPRFLPEDATAEMRLARGEADAALIVADDPSSWLSAKAMGHLRAIPTIVVGARGWDEATVTIVTAFPGIHSGGTVMRCDGATLPLRPSLATDLPSDHDVLLSIHEGVKRLQS